MRFKWLRTYGSGMGMLMSIALFSLWLAMHGLLDLYVHPRYIIFTVILCTLAVAVQIAEAGIGREPHPPMKPYTPARAGITVCCLLLCAAMLVVRPGSLSSSAATQRGLNSGVPAFSTTSATADLSAANTAFSQFGIKDWASLLAQTNDTSLFKDKPAHLTGFITPVPGGNGSVFYISRFVITCCAIDARPVGVPIYIPGWQATYSADDWLDVRGVFMPNPQGTVIPNVLRPQSVTRTHEPDDPYVY